MLFTAAALGLTGCVNAEQSAPPGAGDSVSYGPAASAPASAGPTSGNAGSTGTQTGAHNQADVTFAQQTALLRQQALALATAAGSSSTNAQVKALAAQITHDAGPSVGVLSNLLVQWNQQASQQGPGALSTTQLQQVTSAQGTSFDMQWLQFMKANLQATQQAVNTEQSHGSDQQAVQLAKQWAPALTTELAKIKSIG